MYYMNPYTGTVQSLEDWQEDFKSMSSEEWGGDTFESASLLEVEQDDQGNWIEI